jgi:alkanesulfonate monooxygenase SsuD/methylene tetrahydromethanopterin reductase-like flavin-dependent oxidoreductase (luciferase family)
MELASLCRTHPGRFMPGIGHGMPEWLRQVSAHPGKLLPRIEETTVVVSRLLAGETVDFSTLTTPWCGQSGERVPRPRFRPPEGRRV